MTSLQHPRRRFGWGSIQSNLNVLLRKRAWVAGHASHFILALRRNGLVFMRTVVMKSAKACVWVAVPNNTGCRTSLYVRGKPPSLSDYQCAPL
ncbi:hypothetical protein CC2G_010946 [Coprinopsis cinerea AmutBmut pab1-1]|nr:hypothetical protein CC2G_010946 [Coprinopsis cinerea AmutBmut pab1-1]